MSLTQSNYSPPGEPSPEPFAAGRGLRIEDLLRIIVLGLIVLAGGVTLGNLTFHELQTRGTAYFILAGALAIILTAVAFYRFQPTVALFTALLWVSIGGTPDLATGVSSGTGKSLYPVELGAMFLLFIWVARGLTLHQFRIVRTPMNKWLVLYLAFCGLTAVNGWLFWDPALTHYYAGLPGNGKTAPQVIILELMLRVLSVGMFWLMGSSLTDPKWLRRISFLIFVPAADVFLAHMHFIHETAGAYDILLEFVLASALLAWLLEYPGAKPSLRLLAGVGLLFVVYQAFLLNLHWISGWIGLFSALFYVAWLKSRKLALGSVCMAAVLAFVAKPFLQANVLHKVQTSGDLDRFSMQHAALMYALKFPLGIGPGNFRAYNAYYGSPNMWNTTGYTSAHNFYGQALSEMGFGGLALTLTWVIVGVVMLTRFYRQSPPGFNRTMLLALGGMWTGISVSSYLGDYLIPVYHNGGLNSLCTTIYAWIGLGLAVALARQNGALATDPREPIPDAAPTPIPSAASYYPRRLSP